MGFEKVVRKVLGWSAVKLPRFRDKDFIREFCSLFTSPINVMCASGPDPKVLLFS